jgi:hypothetical protein
VLRFSPQKYRDLFTMTLLLHQSGRSMLAKRLEVFQNEIETRSLLADISREPWFDRCMRAIESVPMLQTLSSHAPEILPFEPYCLDPAFTRSLARRVERLSQVPRFSAKRYRQKFMSDGADVMATLFEINFLGRFSTLEALEPQIGGSSSRVEALIDCAGSPVYLECFVLHYSEMYADLATVPAVLAKRLASKILAKANQLRDAVHPAIVAIALSHQHILHLNTVNNSLRLGGDQALRDPSSDSISGLAVCADFRADQIVGPFRNYNSLRSLDTALIDCLRQPWVADPQWPLSEWSPID